MRVNPPVASMDYMQKSNKTMLGENISYEKRKICIVTTNEMAVRNFLLEHIRALSMKYEVTVIFNTTNIDFLKVLEVNATIIPLSIERKISLWHDIKAFSYLLALFCFNRFDVVHSMAPKSGLLAMFAGFLTHIPVRIHTFTGQVWITRSGLKKRFLKSIDKLLAAFTTHILVDSNSQRTFLVEQGVVPDWKAKVLLNGSFCGVNIKRFVPNPIARKHIRSKSNIPEKDIVFLFLGRLNKDKGVLDLIESFVKIAEDNRNIHIMFIGPDEENMQLKIAESYQQYAAKIHFDGYTNTPEQYLASADVLCLPSYREGFGSVIIEAGAVGIPSIGTRIYGITDAIDEGVTGLLYEPGNIDELTEKMLQFVNSPDLIKSFGNNARKRALREFSQEELIRAMLDYYGLLKILR